MSTWSQRMLRVAQGLLTFVAVCLVLVAYLCLKLGHPALGFCLLAVLLLPPILYTAWKNANGRRKRARSPVANPSSSAARAGKAELDINAQTGAVHLPNGLGFGSSLTEEAFRASPAFAEAKSEDPGSRPWIHYRFAGGTLDGKNVSVSLCFYEEMLVSVDLSADLYPPGPKSWSTYSLKTEAATKDFHDRLLRHLFDVPKHAGRFHVDRPSEDEAILERPQNLTFPWGAVASSHDPRGGGTCITVSYGNRRAAAVAAGHHRVSPATEGLRAKNEIAPSAAKDAVLADAKRELKFGNRTNAIRLVRQAAGLGLQEAQDLVDSWEKKP